MKLLVTGGCGFIGSHFIRHVLAKHADYSVVNLDALTYCGNKANLADIEKNPRYSFVHGDICDAATVKKAMQGCDAVVHFAAESHVDNSIAGPLVFTKTNVEGTHILLETARQVGVKKFVHISTDEVYGSTLTGSFSETNPLQPNSPYSASKAAADLLCRAYFHTYKFPVVITRSSNNFGPNQFPEKLIPLFVTNLIEGKKVPVYGDGLNVRDWLYVKDNADAIDFVLHYGIDGEAYNIGGKTELTNLEITKKLLALCGKDTSSIEFVQDRPGHDRRYALTCDKLEKLGWKNRMPFEQALAETVQWYRDNPQWWQPLKVKK
ncbi:dTDP-glucose 4,6-dehydratase [Candidatus Woesearchaeota archaeon]|nr:dTDP-glucose 4,6-dehydratase [Candidatus Woesearchaeota archaeon]